MEIPTKFRGLVLIVCTLLIVFWIVFFAHRFVRPNRPTEKYEMSGLDRNLGLVAAQEADRLTGGKVNAVLLLREHESNKGSVAAQTAGAYVSGFQNGCYDEKGNLRPDMKILAKRYQTDETVPTIHNWPTLKVLREIARDYPACNVVVSFCEPPFILPEERGQYNARQLSPVIALSHAAATPAQWKAMFAEGLVQVLITARAKPVTGQMAKLPREIVELQYWIVTQDNLEENIRKVGGG